MADGIGYDLFFLLQSAIGVVDMVIAYLLVRNFISYQFVIFLSYHTAMMGLSLLLLAVWIFGNETGSIFKIRINYVSAENIITYMHPIILLFIFNAILTWVSVDLWLQTANNTWNNSYALMLFAAGAVILGCARVPPRKPNTKREEDNTTQSNAINMVNNHENPNKYNYPNYGTSVTIPIGEDIRAENTFRNRGEADIRL